jgi:hypothetical protein
MVFEHGRCAIDCLLRKFWHKALNSWSERPATGTLNFVLCSRSSAAATATAEAERAA